MGKPSESLPVKLIVGLISSGGPETTDAKKILEHKFGPVEAEFGPIDFSATSYYDKEFGANLKRKFLSFKRLISLRKNYTIKQFTNSLEKKLSKNSMRTVNIDPGYVSLAKLILFTTKNRSHRIYIDKGIYGDLELQFSGNSFLTLPWTYPDYASHEYINFFNTVRNNYLKEIQHLLKEKKK